MSPAADIGIVIALVLLNGFFAMSEMAILSARRSRLKQLADGGETGAQLALEMGENPSSFLSIVQTGVTLNSVLTGVFSGATLSDALGEYLNTIVWIDGNGDALAFFITVVGVTYLTLVIGELVPKRVGIAFSETVAVWVAKPMRFFARTASPIVWILTHSTEIILRLLGLGNKSGQGVTEDEIKDMIAEGTESGVLKPAEKDMLERVMRLADRSVRTIMTPRVDMVWLNIDAPLRDHKNVIRSSGYSRFPVARGDLGEIVGIVHSKDLLHASFDGLSLPIKDVMRPPLIVPDTTPVMRLLDQLKKVGQHMAIVVDEYGSVEGMVSLSDIVQSITGGIPGRSRDMIAKPIRRKDGSWLLDGMMPIDEAEDVTGLDGMRGDGDFQTIAGFVMEHLGRLPSTGDAFMWHGARFEVMEMEGRRIDRLIVSMPEEKTTE